MFGSIFIASDVTKLLEGIDDFVASTPKDAVLEIFMAAAAAIVGCTSVSAAGVRSSGIRIRVPRMLP